ncbi:MAG TPA: GDSL-type esterase/lipase family protein [Candidatus Paceibacterota bacterium]|jgi:lysophospholipase L1-like esterase
MTICVFGDSIAWGAYDVEGGWVERLKRYVWTTHDGEVYNLGISGDTSDGVLARLTQEAKPREPDLIIIAVGVNDAQYEETPSNPRTSIESFSENINAIANEAKALAKKVVFIGLTCVDESRTKPISWSPKKFYDNERIRAYNEALMVAAGSMHHSCVRTFDLLEVSDFEDGLHPNSKGHEKLFEHIKDELEKSNLLGQ